MFDLYSKIVMTVIAVSLSVIAWSEVASKQIGQTTVPLDEITRTVASDEITRIDAFDELKRRGYELVAPGKCHSDVDR